MYFCLVILKVILIVILIWLIWFEWCWYLFWMWLCLNLSNFGIIFCLLEVCVGSTWSNFGLPRQPLEPTWAPGPTMIPPGHSFGASLALYEPKLGAKMGQLGPTWNQLGPSWANMEPTWTQLGANLEPTWAILGKLGTNLEPTWSQDEPTWS